MTSITLSDDKLQHNDSILEAFSLIWLDTNHSNDKNRQNTEEQLRSIINHLRKFEDINECQRYFEKIPDKNRLILVVNNQLGRDLVPHIHQLQQVCAIYVYGLDKIDNEKWTNEFKKVNIYTY